MKTILLVLFFAASAYAAEPMNCVNPGGGCDGSVPCCDSHNNACVRGRCQRVPFAFIMSGSTGTCFGGPNCSGATVAPNVSAQECFSIGGYSWDDGAGCESLN